MVKATNAWEVNVDTTRSVRMTLPSRSEVWVHIRLMLGIVFQTGHYAFNLL